MKHKLLTAFLAALLLCGTLSACSSGLGTVGYFNDLYQSSYTAEPAPDRLEAIPLLSGYTLVEKSGNLGLFSKYAGMLGTDYIVYNFQNQSIVREKNIALSEHDSCTISLKLGQILETADGLYALYDQLGNCLASNASRYGHTQDLILVGNYVYRFDLHTYEKTAAVPFSTLSGELPDYDQKAGEYYYRYAEKSLMIFDSDLTYRIGFRYPENAISCTYFPLNEGNVIVQYAICVNDSEQEYTYADEKGCYLLKTHFIDVKSEHIDEQETVCLFDTVFGEEELAQIDFINQSVKQLAYVSMIENHMLESRSLYSVATDGYPEKQFALFSEMYDGILPMGGGCYGAYKDGRTYLLNGTGTVLGDISGVEGYNNVMLATNGEVYGYDMHLITSISNTEGEMQYADATDSLIFFQNENGKCVSVSENGARKTVADGENTFFLGVIGFGIYGVVTGDAEGQNGTYSYYDATGKALLDRAGGEADAFEANGVKVIFAPDENGVMQYYQAVVSTATNN